MVWLVGGLEHLDYFSHHIGNVIIPTDELIFFRGVGIPPGWYGHPQFFNARAWSAWPKPGPFSRHLRETPQPPGVVGLPEAIKIPGGSGNGKSSRN